MSTRGVIVVGVDGSAISVSALRWAVAEAEATGREVVAVTVWAFALGLAPGVATLSADETVAAHRHTLDQVIEDVRRPEVPIRGEVVEGDAGKALLNAARDADLLVLGSHGRGAVLRALAGSVSTYCLRHAACPVVVLPARATGERTEPAVGSVAYTPGPLL